MALPLKQPKKRYFNTKPLRVSNFIKVNNLKPITSPIIFSKSANGLQANPDGLLSHEIFGITQYDRGNTFAYINLGKGNHFLSPVFYKALCKIEGKISDIIAGTKRFSIKNGELVPDEDGETGLNWLYKNFDKLKFKDTGAKTRENYINFIKKFQDRMWITDYVVIPAYYRDVSTDGDMGGVGVGEINQMYTSLIISANSLAESSEYGISMGDAVAGRLQNIIVQIFDWLTGEITGKMGLINRVVTSKSTDMGARVVISAPNLKVEDIEDLMVDIDHCAVPMAALLANFFPYVIFWLRNFFQSEFNDLQFNKSIETKSGNIIEVKVKDPQISFSDEKIKEEIDRFIHGFASRLRQIEVPIEPVKVDGKVRTFTHLRFKGYQVSAEDFAKGETDTWPVQERNLTWCDLFYMALEEVTKDKMVLITRYPIDSCYNQFPTKVRVYSTKKTEPMVVNGKFYKNYPYIRKEMYDTNTTNLFIDTVSLSNVYLKSIGGDYDGDQISVKGIYSIEANKELEDVLNSKKRFIALSNKNIMVTTNEGVDALFALTMALPQDADKLGKPTF